MKVTVSVQEGRRAEEVLLYSDALTYFWTLKYDEIPGSAEPGEKYEVSLDGRRLVMIEQATETPGQIRRRAERRLKKFRKR
ncbi:hypothetical protein [Salisediminibacterium halotolerans]|uniref:Uncharacterized protein n=1 Tax=Salisediminibacterium halotolerans TaxID=517425 RepID=A0A1H9RL76_9BACI|nr:hypothetical protein [Salisediminibacterium haloalkalitolerans]SER73526.1 hypothetical protein SAMN05444126_1056 [Salisediminibacterium haloalkalitolerans]